MKLKNKRNFCIPLQRGIDKFCRNVYFWETKAPAGAPLTKRSFSEHTSRKLIHFHSNLKKWLFPKKWKLDGNLRVKSFFTENLNGPYGPYEHIVRDRSSQYWPKNRVFDENWKIRVPKNSKMTFGLQNQTFETVPSSKMISKYILDHSRVILTQFPYVKIVFLMKINENR